MLDCNQQWNLPEAIRACHDLAAMSPLLDRGADPSGRRDGPPDPRPGDRADNDRDRRARSEPGALQELHAARRGAGSSRSIAPASAGSASSSPSACWPASSASRSCPTSATWARSTSTWSSSTTSRWATTPSSWSTSPTYEISSCTRPTCATVSTTPRRSRGAVQTSFRAPIETARVAGKRGEPLERALQAQLVYSCCRARRFVWSPTGPSPSRRS